MLKKKRNSKRRTFLAKCKNQKLSHSWLGPKSRCKTGNDHVTHHLLVLSPGLRSWGGASALMVQYWYNGARAHVRSEDTAVSGAKRTGWECWGSDNGASAHDWRRECTQLLLAQAHLLVCWHRVFTQNHKYKYNEPLPPGIYKVLHHLPTQTS